MNVIACYSIKGGVGKTALAVNLAYAFRESGLRTLLLDLDPQGATSFYFRTGSAGKFKIRDPRTLADGLRKNIRRGVPGTGYLTPPLTLTFAGRRGLGGSNIIRRHYVRFQKCESRDGLQFPGHGFCFG